MPKRKYRRISRKRRSQQDELSHTSVTNSQKSVSQQDNILHLQQTLGNQATIQLLNKNKSTSSNPTIQRLMSSRSIMAQLGKPKKDTKIFGKTVKKQSTNYRNVLAAVQAVDNFVNKTNVDRNKTDAMGQARTLNQLLDGVIASCDAYISNKEDTAFNNDKKLVLITQLKNDAKSDQALAMQVALTVDSNPALSIGNMNLKWYQALDNARLSSGPVKFGASDVTKQIGSGMGGVDEVNLNGQTSYFSSDKNEVATFAPSNLDKEQRDQVTKGTTLEGAMSSYATMDNPYFVAMDAGMVPENDNTGNPEDLIKHMETGTAARDVASSRLDQLLNGGVIARAQFAIKRTPEGQEVMGSLLDKADGDQSFKLRDMDDDNTQTAVKVDDKNLPRLLSRLQLLDAIAFQIDRGPQNFFIVTDDNGETQAVTGIDNDMAWGELRDDPSYKTPTYPGLSKFVDKEMAETIIALNPDDLRYILSDLLTDSEVSAAIERLTKLQNYLKNLPENQLLAPDEWDDAVQKGLLEENSSYYASFMSRYQKNRKKKGLDE